MNLKKIAKITFVFSAGILLAACTSGNTNAGEKAESQIESIEKNDSTGENTGGGKEIFVDGSSTVFPIMEAVAEEFTIENPGFHPTIGVSGTGGGFEKFVAGETDITNASRPIKEEEKQLLEEAGIPYTEFKLALDGLSIVVNEANDWVDQVTIEELALIWGEGSGVETWADVRKGWPEKPIERFSPGTDSGTYDYFDEVVLDGTPINKKAALSEDDHVLVQGVAGSENAMGYFGYAYYVENKDKVKVVPVVNETGKAVKPDGVTVQDGTYEPFSRPLFIYVKNDALREKEQVYDFVKYTLENAADLAAEVGYVALPPVDYEASLKKLEEIK